MGWGAVEIIYFCRRSVRSSWPCQRQPSLSLHITRSTQTKYSIKYQQIFTQISANIHSNTSKYSLKYQQIFTQISANYSLNYHKKSLKCHQIFTQITANIHSNITKNSLKHQQIFTQISANIHSNVSKLLDCAFLYIYLCCITTFSICEINGSGENLVCKISKIKYQITRYR